MLRENNAAIVSLGGYEYLPKVNVFWQTAQVLNARRFKIYRGQTYDKVDEELGYVDSQPNLMAYSFNDYTPELRDRYRPYYYRIDVYRLEPDEVFEESGEVFTWDSQLRVWEDDVIWRHDLLFHYDAGSPLYFFSERTDSSAVKCPVCWDVTRQESMPPPGGCPLCYGTGRQKPYHDPVLIWAEFGINSRVLEKNLIEEEPGQKQMTFGGLPKIKPGDIVHEPFKHEFWKIERVGLIGRDTAPVLQQCTLALQDENEDLYKHVKVTEEDLAILHKELNAINNERRF